jgi:hypothetical protein
MRFKFLFLFVSFLLIDANADSRSVFEFFQTTENFSKALSDASSSPYYVRIFLEDPNGGIQLTCVLGGDLNLAIRREYGLSASLDGIRKATEIAMANDKRIFLFSNPSAAQAVPLRFSRDDLTAVRSKLTAFSDGELRERFGKVSLGALNKDFRNSLDRDAAACILIERGMSPRVADISNILYIEK